MGAPRRLELASKACKPNGQQKPRAAEMKRLEEDLVFMTTEGMLAPLVEALLSGSPAVKEAAAHALAQHLRLAASPPVQCKPWGQPMRGAQEGGAAV